ncbi:DivIVA domain-containing protein [Micromonospora sp. WMMD723]|uniref:DivIVA domain-containing protein n=1 Tax=Micromonospora sp. WMMD723 TaxID=3403465 RepID=UPI003CF20CCD
MVHRTALTEFGVGLRGYSSDVVDTLVGHARAALDSDDPARGRPTRDELAAARAQGLPVSPRGYDVGQVDAALDDLHAALTEGDDA